MRGRGTAGQADCSGAGAERAITCATCSPSSGRATGPRRCAGPGRSGWPPTTPERLRLGVIAGGATPTPTSTLCSGQPAAVAHASLFCSSVCTIVQVYPRLFVGLDAPSRKSLLFRNSKLSLWLNCKNPVRSPLSPIPKPCINHRNRGGRQPPPAESTPGHVRYRASVFERVWTTSAAVKTARKAACAVRPAARR